MAEDTLRSLQERLDEDLDGLRLVGDALEAVVDCRYGAVVIRVDHDVQAESLRVGAVVPPPAGTGPSFLHWCLVQNTQYWDVKIGLDDEGYMTVHADLDVDPDLARLATLVADRAESIVELLDRDLVEWLLTEGFATPAQRTRWTERPPNADLDDDVGPNEL